MVVWGTGRHSPAAVLREDQPTSPHHLLTSQSYAPAAAEVHSTKVLGSMVPAILTAGDVVPDGVARDRVRPRRVMWDVVQLSRLDDRVPTLRFHGVENCPDDKQGVRDYR